MKAKYPRKVRCVSCGAENPEGNTFCGECGSRLVPPFEKVPVAGDEGAFYCYRHKREATLLTCGRCGKPICTRCVVNGPAGIRCPECARPTVAIRPMGVVNDLSLGFRRFFRQGPWTIYLWVVVLSLVIGSVRGCVWIMRPRQTPPTHELNRADQQEP